MTNKLYYENVYKKEFFATVIDIKENSKNYEIILDKTLFYPEGGGQPSDIGYINNIPVYDVQIKEDIISHYILKEHDINFKVSDEIKGIIDFDRRYELMQCHTAEHLITGISNKLYGYDNVGFNISDHLMTIDLNGKLDEQMVQNLEMQINMAIWQGNSVNISYPTSTELEKLNYRSKIKLEGNVRIVTVNNIDCCACCGLHLQNVSEIGLVKFISVKNHKSGTRILCLAGKRALKDYMYKHNCFNEIGQLMSLKTEKVFDGITKLYENNNQLKYNFTKFKEKHFDYIIKDIKQQKINIIVENNLDDKDMQYINNLLKEKSEIAVVISEIENSVKYCIASKTVDMKQLSKTINETFNGRGGGSVTFAKGVLQTTPYLLQTFIESLEV